MNSWRDIGINDTAVDLERKAQQLADRYVSVISSFPAGTESSDPTALSDILMRSYRTFFEQTKEVLRWTDLPWEKLRFDYEQQMRALFMGYQQALGMSQAQVDAELDKIGKVGNMEFDRGLSFFYAVDAAVAFAQREQLTQSEAIKMLTEFSNTNCFNDALFLSEALLNGEVWGYDRTRKNARELAGRIAEGLPEYGRGEGTSSCQLTSLNDEESLVRHFFETRPSQVVLSQKFIIHSVDGQGSEKMWRTYPQIAERTSTTLASLVTYGLVPGSIVGRSLSTTLFGTLDRADLCIMNWYPEYQSGLLIPAQSFLLPGFGRKLTGSMSTMVDGEKETGQDLIIRCNDAGDLPSISPSKFVIIVPTALQSMLSAKINRIGSALRKSTEEIAATINRCIVYDPSLWKNFHYFNEWLQSTEEGNSILEAKLEGRVSGLKTVPELMRE